MGSYEMSVLCFWYLSFLKLLRVVVDHVLPRFTIHNVVKFHYQDQPKVVETPHALVLKAAFGGHFLIPVLFCTVI